ncbi:MAG: ABC transporter permease [Dehalococcoidia bacterium]|nr:ABC transporter permease [Dehalococcoidia bacterium]
MRNFIFRRFMAALVVLFLTTIIVFILSRMSGDPRHLFITQYTTKEQWDEWGREFGLDKPYPVQYWRWLSKVSRLDFGTSLNEQIPAIRTVRARFPATLQLAAGAFIFALGTGIPLGVFAAISRGKGWDLIGRSFALLGQAMPGFWLGIMLILIFAVHWQLFPPSGRGDLRSMVLPSITLGWFASAALLRLTRSAMLEVMETEFVKLAKAKGVSRWKVIWKHAFRNALVVPITYAGILLTGLLTGAVVTETVFAWPGIGRLAVQSVYNLDFSVVSCIVILATAGYLLMNFFVDILYGLLDPRIRQR